LHEEEQLKPIFKKALKSYQISQSPKFYHSSDSKARAVVGSALTGIFYAAVSQELRPQTLSVYRAVVSHLALQALLESMSIDIDGTSEKSTLDAFLLIDVICQTLSDSCKHFCQAGIVALRFINILVKSIFDSTEELNQAYELPFFRILLERVNQLTYRRDWYAKLGGCTALRFFVDNFTREFVIRHSELFLNALFTVSIFDIRSNQKKSI
jgi:transformation/transcription domain-associated protein